MGSITVSEWREFDRRCGVQSGRFYDCNGEFFREGYDPRNHRGRFVESDFKRWVKLTGNVLREAVEAQCTHDQDCVIHMGDCSL